MAVIRYQQEDVAPITRNFQPPKRAGELKYWWKAAQKAVPGLPSWQDAWAATADVTVESIIIEGSGWVAMISRKQYLKG